LIVKCGFDKDCGFKSEQNDCKMVPELCNQQARPYYHDGALIYLRKSDLVLIATLATLQIKRRKEKITI